MSPKPLLTIGADAPEVRILAHTVSRLGEGELTPLGVLELSLHGEIQKGRYDGYDVIACALIPDSFEDAVTILFRRQADGALRLVSNFDDYLVEAGTEAAVLKVFSDYGPADVETLVGKLLQAAKTSPTVLETDDDVLARRQKAVLEDVDRLRRMVGAFNTDAARESLLKVANDLEASIAV